MDRLINGQVTRRTSFSLGLPVKEPETPYEKLLQNIAYHGDFTPKRKSTRSNRVLNIQNLKDLPRKNLTSQLTQLTRQETLIEVSTWLQDHSDSYIEPKSIQCSRILEARNLEDDYYLSLLDWSGFTNQIAVGLTEAIYTWNGETEETKLLAKVSVGNEDSVASVAWKPHDTCIAIGTKHGKLELLDTITAQSLRRFKGHCEQRTGTLSWNAAYPNLISSGGRDKIICHHDIRSRDPIAISRAHNQEVCGLKWDFTGTKLASGGNDNRVMIWDPRHFSSPVTIYDKHCAAVKALAWSPHVNGLLATGGGTADRTVRFWNTRSSSGDSIKIINVNSQVCNMVWSPISNDLVTTHGFSDHQVLRWNYPKLTNTGVMLGHQQRVLHLCLSPDGRKIVTGSSDETLRFWDVFEEKKSENRPNSFEL